MSNEVSAQKLDAFIRENNYDKVVLIAHSMGGLVASGYMSMGQEQRNKVKESFLLASPLLGTPEAINVWANLDFSALTESKYEDAIDIVNAALSILTLTYNPIQKLFSNYQSIYELFPTEKYIDAGADPYLLHSYTVVNIFSGSETEALCMDYSTSMHYVSDYLPHFNSSLLSSAENFRRSCYINSRHISDIQRSNFIYVTNQEVTTRLKYYEVVSSESYSRGVEIEDTALVGDGLVPYWSATAGKTGYYVWICPGRGHLSPIKREAAFTYIKGRMGMNQ